MFLKDRKQLNLALPACQTFSITSLNIHQADELIQNFVNYNNL